MSVYSKNLSGLAQRVFVSATGVNYTAQTTLNAFIDSAAEGEIGVFLDTGAVRTIALTTGLKFQIAQKRDGYVTKTPLITFGTDTFNLRRTAYTAPVRQVTSIGYDATANTLGYSFTGATNSNTLTFGVSVRDTTPGNQPFPIQEGYGTTTSATQDQYDITAVIVSQLNGDYDYERAQPDRFVRADIQMDGTRTALAANATVVQGSYFVTVTAHALPAGTKISLANVIYKIKTVVDANTFILDRPYQGATGTVTAGTSTSTGSSVTYVSGTNLIGIRFTGLDDYTTFKVAGSAGLLNASTTNVTAWLLGSGSGASVKALEATEGIIFDGVNSVRNVAFKEDWGVPTLFSNVATTYDLFFLDFQPSITPSAAPPLHTTRLMERIIIAAPSSGTTSSDELQTIFGV